MTTFKVKITEIAERVIEIKANSKDEAISKVEKDYYDEKHVLDYSDHSNTSFEIIK